MIDPQSILRAVQAALPTAAPFAVVPMLAAQLPHVDSSAGLALLNRITNHMPASAWGFTDAALDSWPEPVAQRALACVRALPAGKDRIHALCTVASRLSRAEQREALDGILDGTLPSCSYEYSKPLSYDDVITEFVRTLPEAWREEWIRTRATDEFAEARARRSVACLTEPAVRRLWSRDSSPFGGVPSICTVVAGHLPSDLKALALKRLRARKPPSSRLLYLSRFDDELTDAERYEVVEVPWNAHTRDDPRAQADHLQSVARHLPGVPVELRQRWLRIVLSFTEDFDRQRGLMALLPSLSGPDYRQAADALVASVIREGRFHTTETRWDLLPDDALGPLLLRLLQDPYGWSRDQLIAHLGSARDPALADRCLRPLLDGLSALDPDHCVEIVHAMTPWLAARSDNAVPRALAALPVPAPQRPANPLYVIERVFCESMDELFE